MKTTLKIKDWLIQKNAKIQFRPILADDRTIFSVETNQGLRFRLGTSEVDKTFRIIKFHDDKIHVSYSFYNTTFCSEIKEVPPIYAYNYKPSNEHTTQS